MAEEQSNDVLLGVQDLTAEERQELENQIPSMLAGAEAGKLHALRALSAWISKRRGLPISEEAKASAEEMRATIAAAPAEQGSMLGWFGFPTVLTRTSPFFPKNRNELATGEGLERKFLRNYVITAAGWGELLYSGPVLTTYEEDALWAVLAMLDAVSKYRSIEGDKGEQTFTYRGPARPILLLMGHKQPSSTHRKRLVESCELMTTAAIKMAASGGKTKTGKKRAPRKTDMSNILSNVSWDEEAKELAVTVNPFFYEAYCSAKISLMSMAVRAKLTSPVAKALYRFVQSHRAGRCFEGHFLTLCDALNMDRDQPMTELRRILKRAIASLITAGVLSKQSKFVSQDIVILDRTDGALPAKKKTPKKVK